MSPSLPTLGQNPWQQQLQDWLLVSHNPDGTANGIGTTLPASPYDGQEYILVDVLNSPNYVWRMRYTAAVSGTYKWICVGGVPALMETGTNFSFTGAWTAAPAPVLTINRAGWYYVGADLNGVTAVSADVDVWIAASVNSPTMFGSTQRIVNGARDGVMPAVFWLQITAGQIPATLKWYAQTTQAVTVVANSRHLTCIPVQTA